MHPIFYYIIIFLVIGAVGMAIGNRKVETKVSRQRWLKYFTYIIFTGIIVLSILFNFFFAIAALIVFASFIELVKAVSLVKEKNVSSVLIPFFIFLVIVTGYLLFAQSFENQFLLFIYFQLLVFDGFCQITGQLFGKHQLAPKISPSKTWEGLAGGLLCCIIAAVLAKDWVSISFLTAIFFGLLTGLSGFTGDMLASYYKRKAGIKDYSNWLPGQGGFLDRFDSFLVTGFVYFILYSTIFKYAFSIFIKT
jgi:phosphatidate cytidylyltransferase